MSFVPINLPSKCIPYEGINPGDITIRPYQVKDEKVLAQINPINLEQKYLQILKEVVKGIDPKKLTTGDKLYIILWEYINSYSETLLVRTYCSHCIREVEVVINLSNLDVVYLSDSFKCPHPVSLFSKDESGEIITVNLRPITVGDEIETEKYNDDHDDAIIYRYARSIVDDRSTIEKMEWLFSLEKSTRDMARIRAFHEKYYHGPDLTTKFQCPKCGGEEEVDIPFRLDFVYPDGETLTNTFGKGI